MAEMTIKHDQSNSDKTKFSMSVSITLNLHQLSDQELLNLNDQIAQVMRVRFEMGHSKPPDSPKMFNKYHELSRDTPKPPHLGLKPRSCQYEHPNSPQMF